MKNKYKLGSWILTYNPAGTDVMSKSGFDWICIDLEHSSITFQELDNLLSILEKNKVESFVRVSSNNKSEIKKALDLGARGIIVPMVNTGNEAQKALRYASYPPRGERGFAIAKAQGYGYGLKNYEKISKKIKVVVQIETIQGINNLEQILKVKGLYSTFVGPMDLSGSIGKPGDYKNKKFLNALKKYEQLSKKNKISMGIHVAYLNVNEVKSFIKKGYKFIAMGTDMTFLGNACLDSIKKIKK